jgi:hypothetical protein
MKVNIQEFSVGPAIQPKRAIFICGWHEHYILHFSFVTICWLQSFEIREHDKRGFALKKYMVVFF